MAAPTPSQNMMSLENGRMCVTPNNLQDAGSLIPITFL